MIVFTSILLLWACQNSPKTGNTRSAQTVNWVSKSDTTLAIVVAKPITYDVVVRAHSYDDEWTHQCLDSSNIDAFTDYIFQAIYQKKLTPYNYFTDEKMSLSEVKKLEKEFARKRIGKMQFIEDWYFDADKMQFYKKVKGIMLAYERYRADSTVRNYKAGIKVYFQNE